MPRQLDPADVEAIAVRVVEMLDDRPPSARLVSAAELSRRLGLSRSTVYAKAQEFGAVRIGSGPRARLRFDAALVAKRLGLDSPVPPPSSERQPVRRHRRRARRRPAQLGLLPIRGDAPR
jgi:hypothetical protein